MDEVPESGASPEPPSKPLPWRAVALAGLLIVGGAVALVLAERSTHHPAAPAGRSAKTFARTPVSVRISSTLPDWLAPGAPIVVTGWTSPNVRVALVLAGRRVGVVRAGSRGRFVLAGVTGRSGNADVLVRAGGRDFPVGKLVVRPIRIAAVGDVTPGEGVSDAVTSGSRAASYAWAGVGRLLRSADIATANLEGAIAAKGDPVPNKEYHFRGSQKFLRGSVTAGGLDVVTVANNHSLDFGRPGLLATLRAVRAVHLRSVGGGANLAQARRPVVLVVGGLRVALLGYSDIRPAGFDAGPSSPGATPAEPSLIEADVARARKHADVVVVWFHWGVERAVIPDARQRLFAKTALAAGASLVLGAHPHVLQPLQRKGHTLVAWSLGNFVFPSGGASTRTGVLLVGLDARGVSGAKLVPATIHGYRPVLNQPVKLERAWAFAK
ncbi:MAG: hypothetical protein F2663_08285 [Actinobacteria bacterium]|uniref:Unannotated protein n=1 Tax=freshwater metagenome TaxID=449393 RepID=A0A6J6Q5Q8_9ZZZZ|nr:hypothetical protein [Actinomycetota bacterium]